MLSHGPYHDEKVGMARVKMIADLLNNGKDNQGCNGMAHKGGKDEDKNTENEQDTQHFHVLHAIGYPVADDVEQAGSLHSETECHTALG